MTLIKHTFTCSIIIILYSCFASTSMEFNSARTYARIEDNLIEAVDNTQSEKKEKIDRITGLTRFF